MVREPQAINKKIAVIIRIAGFVVPFMLVFYAVLVRLGVADDSHVGEPIWFNLTLIAWSALTILHLILDTSNRRHAGFLLICYSILIIPYALFISGFVSPFISGWLIIFLATYIYFGIAGIKLSVLSIVFAALADIIINSHSLIEVTEIAFTTLALLFVGLIILLLSRVQEVDWNVFIRTKTESQLQRERAVAVMNHLSDTVIHTNSNGSIQLYNPATEALLSTRANLSGKNITDYLTLYDEEGKTYSLLPSKKESVGGEIRTDLSLRRKNKTINIELSRTPLKTTNDDKTRISGYVFILRDITNAKTLDVEKDDFISIVTHELRTPITVAEGALSNLKLFTSRGDVSQDLLTRQADSAHSQIIYLSRMINDLSTLSRAKRGLGDEPEFIHIDDLLSELYKNYEPRAKRKKLKLDISTDGGSHTVFTSSLYLKELLQNFITNALKYTETGTITVSVEKTGRQVRFAVKDTGIGISKADQEKIFSKFFRSSDHRAQDSNGTGLGLYVAAKLAEKIGTNIELRSRLNHGSEFSFTLPIKKPGSKTS